MISGLGPGSWSFASRMAPPQTGPRLRLYRLRRMPCGRPARDSVRCTASGAPFGQIPARSAPDTARLPGADSRDETGARTTRPGRVARAPSGNGRLACRCRFRSPPEDKGAILPALPLGCFILILGLGGLAFLPGGAGHRLDQRVAILTRCTEQQRPAIATRSDGKSGGVVACWAPASP